MSCDATVPDVLKLDATPPTFAGYNCTVEIGGQQYQARLHLLDRGNSFDVCGQAPLCGLCDQEAEFRIEFTDWILPDVGTARARTVLTAGRLQRRAWGPLLDRLKRTAEAARGRPRARSGRRLPR